MPSYYVIIAENLEDKFDTTDNLQIAIRGAREAAKDGRVGDPVYIEHHGKNIRQFVLMTDGKVAEEALD